MLKRTLQCAVIVSFGVSLSACGTLGSVFSSKKPPSHLNTTLNKPSIGSVQAVYQEAKTELNDSNWTRAIEMFEKVQTLDSLSVYGQQSLLDMAYAQWRNTDTPMALMTLEQYMIQFPKGEGMPYSLYLKGLINFNERSGLLSVLSKQDLSERDPKSLEDSYQAFERLVREYPNSPYAKEAQERLTYIVNTLAQHEVGIARFYLQHKAPLAAVNRSKALLEQFANTPAQEEALGIMIQAYTQLNMPQLKEDAQRVLKLNYPNSPYLEGNLYAESVKSWFKLW